MTTVLRPYYDGRPSESESESQSKTESKPLSSSSSSSSQAPPFSSLYHPSHRNSTETKDDRTDDDDGELLNIFNQVANSGIPGAAACMSQLATWRNEYGLEALSTAVNKAILHGARSLTYIAATLANKDRPKPTKDNSYSQRDYSNEDNALPEWQLNAMGAMTNADSDRP